jgi:mannose-6-phosphate isomerase-like protein (cupin superfamily)
MGKSPAHVIAVVLLGVILTWGRNASHSLAQDGTPKAASPFAISSEVLGRAIPVAVENPELVLARVTVMPGGVLPVHYHPGTQIGVVVQGELTYTVFTGEIEWYQGDDSSDEPRAIGPGETVVVRPGDALVESPD